jgi:hypothetical protein
MRRRKNLRPPNQLESNLAAVVNLAVGYGWQTGLLLATVVVVLWAWIKQRRRQ